MQAKKTHSAVDLKVPREHGFWVMLVIALVASVGRSEELLHASGVAAALAALTIVLGGRFHKKVRKTPWAQVVASALLGTLVLPIEGIGRVPIRLATVDSLAWIAVFSAFSLSVRAIFARARKGGSGVKATLLALTLPPTSGSALFLLDGHRNSAIAAVGLGGCVLFAIWRPKPRHLKQSGVMMTALLALALALMLCQ
ncbi:MAG: hypothetical protein GY811_01370 [Myxococcales bacterium]|nr:hypothetical protein [Myxococcales bacterium]